MQTHPFPFLTLLAVIPLLTSSAQVEQLDRGLVAVPCHDGKSVALSWRFFSSDLGATTFEILRDGKSIKQDILQTTFYVDEEPVDGGSYSVVTHHPDKTTDTTKAVFPWSDVYYSLPLNRPAGGYADKREYSYTPSDCSTGDVDGDGEYEIVLKWDPTNAHDNSHSGYTGNVLLDCYKLDGTQLWRIDLGHNIRAGAHYTQFLVYDFDGNGCAELICKTAPGSTDGTGRYVNAAAKDTSIQNADNNADYRNSTGKIDGGQEYLTVFKGATGEALHTIFYNPNRNAQVGGDLPGTFNWGAERTDDGNYGNRGERYLATVAFLDGADKAPCAVMCRGYYTFAFLWAVGFDGKELSTKWLHYSKSPQEVEITDAAGNVTTRTYTTNTADIKQGSCTAYGNGNHNLACADVDGDGCDEIVYGSCAIDHDGSLIYATGYGHGDAMHLSDLIPDRRGLEVFQVHENGFHSWDIHDAATGEILHHGETARSDNGRGIAADIDKQRGFEFVSAADRLLRNAQDDSVVADAHFPLNFRIYWDGDLQDELLDGNRVYKWTGDDLRSIFPKEGYDFCDIAHSTACNGTKNTPNLQADILGDWREEIVLWDGSDSAHLNIFTTTEPTMYRVPTLMHDHTYRISIAWQNVAYNQPPHLGYYLPDLFDARE